MEHDKSIRVLTPEMYHDWNERYVPHVPLWSKIKWFFKHVYYMSIAPRSPERDHYRSTFKQYEMLAKKEEAKKQSKK